MPRNPQRFYQGSMGTAETNYATTPAATQWVVKEIIVANTSSSAGTFSISVVPSGQLASTTNRIVNVKSIPANDTLVFALSTVMNAGDFLSGIASASNITITFSGVAIS